MRPFVIVVALSCSFTLSAQPTSQHPIGPRGMVGTTGVSPEEHAGAVVEPQLSEVQLLKYAITQGGLIAVLCVVLWSYRRDFLRKQEDLAAERALEKQRTDMIVVLVEKSGLNELKKRSPPQ